MAEYEVSNPLADSLSIRSGPGVIYDKTGSLGTGQGAKGDFIYTYQSVLVTDNQPRSAVGDQWVHVIQLEGAPVDGWTALIHLGKPYASATRSASNDLEVTFGVDLEGYNPITLTGTLTPK